MDVSPHMLAQATSRLPDLFGGDLPVAHVALGLLLGLLGWPIYSALVRLTGAIAGLALGLALVLLTDEFIPLDQWLVPSLVLAAIIGALIGLWFVRRMIPVVWMLFGVSLGILGIYTAQHRLEVLDLASMSPGAQVAIWGGGALVTGLLTVWLRRWLIMLATATLGAALLAPFLTPLGPPTLAWWSAGTMGFFAAQAGLDRLIGLDSESRNDDDD